MIKHIKTFFYPDVLTYSYNQSKELVITRVEEIFKRKVTFFTSNDMKGRFLSNESFVINTVSPTSKYGSRLVGRIIESQKGITQIETKARPNIIFYFLFFGSIFLGLAYLYNFIQTRSTEFLLWSLVMIIIGPTLSIGVSNVAIASIRERYTMYIDKELIAEQR